MATSTAKSANQKKNVAKTQILKDYRQRLRDNIKSLRENMAELFRLAKIDNETQVSPFTYFEQDQYELQARAANMAKAAENLIKLISDLKQFMILNDFAFVNETVTQTNTECLVEKQNLDERVITVKDEISSFLQEIEHEYYNPCFSL